MITSRACVIMRTSTVGIITPIRCAEERGLSPPLAVCATRTTTVITSACRAMFTVLTAPPNRNCRSILSPVSLNAAMKPQSGYPWWQQVKHERKYQVHHRDEAADKPGGAAGIGHQRGRQTRDQHHGHRAWPELQVHRRGAEHVAEQHQHRCDEERDLRGASQRDADTEIEPVLARGGEGGRHFG